jgi:hypothetical protein
VDLPLIKEYKKAFNIEGHLQELVHLICAKPFLHSLAFQNIDQKWHEDPINFEAELDRSGDTFSKYIFKGYTSLFRTEDFDNNTGYFHHESLRTKSYKKYSESAVALLKSAGGTQDDPVKTFFGQLFTHDIVLPYGILDGFTILKSYPTIAAINTYCGYFGNPVLRQAYQIRTTDSSELKEYGNIKEWLISLIGDSPSFDSEDQDYNSLSGSDMRYLNSISSAEFAQRGAQLALLDEPKLYSAKGDEIFQEYLKVIISLDQVYNQGRDSGLFDLLKEARGAIMELRNIDSYIEAKLKWQSLEVSTPEFPLFAWDFDNSEKASKARDEAAEVRFQELSERISESNSEEVEKDSIQKELWQELENNQYSNFDTLTLSKKDLIDTCSDRRFGKNGLVEVYEAILKRTSCGLIIEAFMKDAKANTVKVEALSKNLRDLSLLSHLLKEVGFFKTAEEATNFVAFNFKVIDKSGHPKSYLASTIRQKKKVIKDSKGKRIWLEWKAKIDLSFDSEI